jgi:hypothetical protein
MCFELQQTFTADNQRVSFSNFSQLDLKNKINFQAMNQDGRVSRATGYGLMAGP